MLLSRPYYPAGASTPAVWAPPLSLATTRGITLVLFSCRYLDVSVRGVRPALSGARPSAARVSPFGHPRINGHLRLPAAFRSLSRPSSPPRATGIPRAPFSFSFPHPRLPTGLLVFSVSRYVNELSRPPSPRRLSAPAAIPPVPGSPAPRVRLVVPSGVEPLTPTLSVWCSDQLSYGTGLSNCSTLHVRNSKKLQE